MEATLDELASHGYADFSVERVAALASVNKTTIYRRWGARDDLIAAAIHTAPPDNRIPGDTGTLRGDLIAQGLEYIAFFDNSRAVAVTRVMNATDAPQLMQARRKLFAAREAATRSIYERAVRRDELSSMAGVDTVVTMMFGAVHHHAFVMGRPLNRRFVEAVVDHALSALGIATTQPTS